MEIVQSVESYVVFHVYFRKVTVLVLNLRSFDEHQIFNSICSNLLIFSIFYVFFLRKENLGL